MVWRWALVKTEVEEEYRFWPNRKMKLSLMKQGEIARPEVI